MDAELKALKIRALKKRLDKGILCDSCAVEEVGVDLETLEKLSWREIDNLWPLVQGGNGR